MNIRDHRKFTPMHCVAMIGNVEMGQILIEHHADLYAKDDQQRTPFDVAMEYENYIGELR